MAVKTKECEDTLASFDARIDHANNEIIEATTALGSLTDR